MRYHHLVFKRCIVQLDCWFRASVVLVVNLDVAGGWEHSVDDLVAVKKAV